MLPLARAPCSGSILRQLDERRSSRVRVRLARIQGCDRPAAGGDIQDQEHRRSDAIAAAEGVVALAKRLWPALQEIDTSSGALGNSVNHALKSLLPILIAAPADPTTRRRWLERLHQAIQNVGVPVWAMSTLTSGGQYPGRRRGMQRLMQDCGHTSPARDCSWSLYASLIRRRVRCEAAEQAMRLVLHTAVK